MGYRGPAHNSTQKAMTKKDMTRKEWINRYKEMKFPMGVFQIRNKFNGKVFIGSSINLTAMQNRLKLQLSTGTHPNSRLQKEWNEFGPENFAFEVLSEIKHEDTRTEADYKKEAEELAVLFLEEIQPYGDKGYHTKKSV